MKLFCVISVTDKKEAIRKALRRLPELKDLKREIEAALRCASPIQNFLANRGVTGS